MTFDYEKLERDLEQACEAVHQEFLKRFKSNDGYASVGGTMLEAFINDLKTEFENTTFDFLKKHGLINDPEAKKRALTITKLYAKKCMEDYSRVLE